MDTALGLGASAPAAGAGVLAGCHGLRAGHASNAGEACVVQRIVGEFVQVDVGPDIVFRPERERIHLYELIRLIPSHHIGSGAEVRLVAADAGDPCPAACQELPEWLYFRSEEHTSELQSRGHLVCRRLLEQKTRPPRWSHD